VPFDYQISAFFDRLAEDWDESTDHHPSKLERIVRLLALEPGDTVLDVGCGTGVMVPYLVERVDENGGIVAIDISPKMIEVAERKFPPEEYPNVEFIAADVNEIRLGNGYDAVICYSCFPHFHDQRATIRHLSQGLKTGGTLAVAHSESRDAINAIHANGPEEIRDDYLPQANEIAEMMADAGLEVIETIDDEETFVVVGRKQ
jgi:ubiquinone/menaquinone biosynthesis C-methylase UbiE